MNNNLLWLEQWTCILEIKGGSEFGRRILYLVEKLVCFLYPELQLSVIYKCQSQSATILVLFCSYTGSWHCTDRTSARLTKEMLNDIFLLITDQQTVLLIKCSRNLWLYTWLWLTHFRLKVMAHNEPINWCMLLSCSRTVSLESGHCKIHYINTNFACSRS